MHKHAGHGPIDEPLACEWFYGFAKCQTAKGNPVLPPALDSIPYWVAVLVTDAKGNKGRATWE